MWRLGLTSCPLLLLARLVDDTAWHPMTKENMAQMEPTTLVSQEIGGQSMLDV